MKSIAFAIIALAAPASADDASITAVAHNTIGVDGIGVLPLGDYAHAATFGIGALGRLEIPAGPGFFTVRAGVIAHAGGDVSDASLVIVPIYAGFRVALGTGGGYLAGELGLSEVFATVDTGVGRASASDTKLGLTAAVGLRRNGLDLRAGLFAPDIDNAVGLMASAGYDFAVF